MIVCPVCEHAQATGGECEVCGKRLSAPGAPPPPSPVLEGLEPTRAAAVVAVPSAPLGDLEPTRMGPADDVLGDVVPGLEATAAAPVDADGAPIPDLERSDAPGLPDDLPSLAPMVVVCRYCRTPSAAGERICSRCGMRLPVVATAPAAAPQEPTPVICSCGTPVRAAMCPVCGARHATG